VNFRNDLLLGYLHQLAKYGNALEFERIYLSLESYLIEKAQSAQDKVTLTKVNEILAYRKNSLKVQL